MSFEFNFTQEQLAKILPNNQHIDHWFSALSTILPDYDITSLPRVSMFLAQTAHESGDFQYIKENLNYKAESLLKVFPKYFNSIEIANKYAHQPEKIANRVYANRMGNGPESSGDGYKYCGRGLIQLTGKYNYSKFGESIEVPLSEIPDYLSTFEGAIQGSCWFWEENNLNDLVDKNNFTAITKKINGGLNGQSDRENKLEHIITLLSKPTASH